MLKCAIVLITQEKGCLIDRKRRTQAIFWFAQDAEIGQSVGKQKHASFVAARR